METVWCRGVLGRSSGARPGNPAGCHRWRPRIKIHLGEGSRLCGWITVPDICSSDSVWSFLTAISWHEKAKKLSQI